MLDWLTVSQALCCCGDMVVKSWIRRFSVFVFGLIFLVLASGLFSQAEEGGPVVHSVDPYYPVDKVRDLGFVLERRVDSDSPLTLSSKLKVTREQRESLFSIQMFSRKAKGWDLLAVDQFILRARQWDLKRLQKAYPFFSLTELSEISKRARVD